MVAERRGAGSVGQGEPAGRRHDHVLGRRTRPCGGRTTTPRRCRCSRRRRRCTTARGRRRARPSSPTAWCVPTDPGGCSGAAACGTSPAPTAAASARPTRRGRRRAVDLGLGRRGGERVGRRRHRGGVHHTRPATRLARPRLDPGQNAGARTAK